MRGREGDRERESVTNIERKRRKNSIVSIPLRILFDIVLMFATAAAVYNIVVVCSLNIFLSFITCLYLCQSQFEVISSCSKCSIFLFIRFYCCTISNWTKTTTSFWLLRPNSYDWTNKFIWSLFYYFSFKLLFVKKPMKDTEFCRIDQRSILYTELCSRQGPRIIIRCTDA